MDLYIILDFAILGIIVLFMLLISDIIWEILVLVQIILVLRLFNILAHSFGWVLLKVIHLEWITFSLLFQYFEYIINMMYVPIYEVTLHCHTWLILHLLSWSYS